MSEDKSWWVYLIRCRDSTLYCGITTDVSRRFAEHQSQCPKCAKYLRGRTPLTLVYQCEIGDRSEASREEYRIKQLSRSQKKKLIADAESKMLK
ncbi:MAG: putative endonuclease [Akkermansiaceae bacterium]|jgi:putative endonuclease